MISKKLALLTSIITLTLSAGALANKPIYKWKDSQGNIKYTQSKPPRGVDYETIYQRTSPAPAKKSANNEQGQSISSEQDEILAKQNAEKERVKKANAEIRRKNCQIAQNNLDTLQNTPRVMTIVDGKEKMLSEKDRQDRLSTAKDHVSKYCD